MAQRRKPRRRGGPTERASAIEELYVRLAACRASLERYKAEVAAFREYVQLRRMGSPRGGPADGEALPSNGDGVSGAERRRV